jgi:hypothetical protein
MTKARERLDAQQRAAKQRWNALHGKGGSSAAKVLPDKAQLEKDLSDNALADVAFHRCPASCPCSRACLRGIEKEYIIQLRQSAGGPRQCNTVPPRHVLTLAPAVDGGKVKLTIRLPPNQSGEIGEGLLVCPDVYPAVYDIKGNVWTNIK